MEILDQLEINSGTGGAGGNNSEIVYSLPHINITPNPPLPITQFLTQLNDSTINYSQNFYNLDLSAQSIIVTYLESINYHATTQIKASLIAVFSNTTNNNWLANAGEATQVSIFNNLVQHNFNDVSTDFVNWGINYLITNPNVIWEDFENQFMGLYEGQDGTYDQVYWNNPNLTFPTQTLPSWVNFYNGFPFRPGHKYMPANEVYALVGGQLYNSHLSNPNAYSNACAIRVSRALNYSGVVIPQISGQTEKGSDNKNYFLNAKNLNSWMRKTFGIPSGSNHLTGAQGGTEGENFPSLLDGKKGIYIMIANYPGLFATGHADIMKNGLCPGGQCWYNPTGGEEYIDVWILN